jgi:hypothetical protein
MREVESEESYLGSEDVRDVMCMDAHCWSARGEKDKMCHPHGDSLKYSISKHAPLCFCAIESTRTTGRSPCGASGQDRPNQRILLSRPVWLVQPVLGKTNENQEDQSGWSGWSNQSLAKEICIHRSAQSIAVTLKKVDDTFRFLQT